VAPNDAPGSGALSSLVDRLADDLGRRWRAGERPAVEDYLARYPQLCDRPEAAAELIYEELCLRREYAEAADAAEVLARFPQWRDQLRVVFELHQLLEGGAEPLRFPAPGEDLGDFHLLAELGRGARGRVFLATQPALGDRPVVLKLSPRTGHEHLSLARLQHSHIVPLYSVHEDAARGLRALCMPYFGGATLARLLELLHGRAPGRRGGQLLLDALRQAQAGAALDLPIEGPVCRFLERSSYARSVCWMGTCLAEALQYTHDRGLVHLDLKPSNVLWAADGQPMVLDLHLAQPPLPAGAAPPAWLGGTPAYMAPEQRRALAAVRDGRRVDAAVDGRADVYSLGLLLCETLGGALPPPGPAAAAWVRLRNPQVSAGLADTLGKCLADEPGDRYPDAAALADELRRHLTDRPPQGPANRGFPERWRNGRPLLRLVGLLLAAMAGAAMTLACMGQLPFAAARVEELRTLLSQAERSLAAQELHGLVERLGAGYAADGPPPAELRSVEAHCRSFWQRRDQIALRLGVPPGPAAEQVRNDLLDLALLWIDLRVRLAGPGEVRAARQEALEVLAQAEALFGASCVLEYERRAQAAALGLGPPGQKAVPPPRTAWEHYALGRARLRAGDRASAAADLQRAAALQHEPARRLLESLRAKP
jgi:serine/threonine protein kinase